MKWSRFVFKTKVENAYVLLCTKNSAIIALDMEEYSYINKHLFSPVFPFCSTLSSLIEMGFIVDDTEDEGEKFIQETASEWENTDEMRIVLSGTTACNFKCAYCFENGIGKGAVLTENIIQSLTNFVETTLKSHPTIKHFVLVLFGGEPTLNWNPLMLACEQLLKICNKSSVSFETRITTNGFLLDNQKLMDLKRYNCTNIEVTLDGPERIHNQRRMLQNGSGTFRTIIRNIDDALRLECVPFVNVRINIDRGNISYIEELLIFLSSHFKKGTIIVSLGTVDPIPSQLTSQQNCKLYENNQYLSIEEFSDYLIMIFPILDKYGFIISNVYSFDGNCIAKSRFSFVLNADGKIFSCMSLIGRDEYAAGNIGSHLEAASLARSFDFANYRKCLKKGCEFLPYCHTGCIFSGLVENGSVSDHSCYYKSCAKVNDFLLKLAYARGAKFETET